MIERRAEADGIRSAAWYSPCEAYRYGLERRWGTGGALLFVMLNPSTATEDANDPTIARCQRRTQQLGFGAMRIANLFGYRATRPRDLARAKAPVGPENRKEPIGLSGSRRPARLSFIAVESTSMALS